MGWIKEVKEPHPFPGCVLPLWLFVGIGSIWECDYCKARFVRQDYRDEQGHERKWLRIPEGGAGNSGAA